MFCTKFVGLLIDNANRVIYSELRCLLQSTHANFHKQIPNGWEISGHDQEASEEDWCVSFTPQVCCL